MSTKPLQGVGEQHRNNEANNHICGVPKGAFVIACVAIGVLLVSGMVFAGLDASGQINFTPLGRLGFVDAPLLEGGMLSAALIGVMYILGKKEPPPKSIQIEETPIIVDEEPYVEPDTPDAPKWRQPYPPPKK
jgi:hypothetical protein